MRERSKSCFISAEELQKQQEKGNNEESFDNFSQKIVDDIIEQIESQIPSADSIPYEERLQKIKWKKIQCDGISYKKIKSFITELLEKARKHRILTEILTDVKDIYRSENEHFKKDLKNTINKFHLDGAKKEKKKIVRTPFHDYYDSIKDEGVKINEARKKYKQMDDHEKIDWLLKFLEVENGKKLNLVQFNFAKETFNQHEMTLINAYEEKPKKMSAFNKFIQNYIKNVKESGTELSHPMIFKQATEAYKNLSETEKLKMQEETIKLKAKYDENLQKFLEGLPADRKLKNVTTKKKSKTITKETLKQKNIEDCFVIEKNSKRNGFSSENEENGLIESIFSPKKKRRTETQNETESPSKKIKTKSKKTLDANTSLNNSIKKNKKSVETASPTKKTISSDVNSTESNSYNKLNQKEPVCDLKKPPESVYKYYVLYLHKGSKDTAKTKYKSLTEEEKIKISKKHKKAQEKFLKKFTEYLKTLSIEEIENIQNKDNADASTEISDLSLDESEFDSD